MQPVVLQAPCLARGMATTGRL
uniref:Uncharacterized protein n=1 Tax=Arundo donax TaxID=35708 RepID=A0A0A9BL76_ARUDO